MIHLHAAECAIWVYAESARYMNRTSSWCV